MWDIDVMCTLILFQSNSVDVDDDDYNTNFTQWNEPNLVFATIILRTRGNNGLKFVTMMYADHHKNWLDFGYAL